MNEICAKMGDADEAQMEQYMEELGVIQDMLTMHDFYMIDAKVEEVARALGPVSYTHLDVYKRQTVDCGRTDCERKDGHLYDRTSEFVRQ